MNQDDIQDSETTEEKQPDGKGVKVNLIVLIVLLLCAVLALLSTIYPKEMTSWLRDVNKAVETSPGGG